MEPRNPCRGDAWPLALTSLLACGLLVSFGRLLLRRDVGASFGFEWEDPPAHVASAVDAAGVSARAAAHACRRAANAAHVAGKWALVNATRSGTPSPQLHPPCCGWDGADLSPRPPAPRDDPRASLPCGVQASGALKSVQWRGNATALMPAGGNSCACSPERLLRLPLLAWIPAPPDAAAVAPPGQIHCPALHEWDAVAFCDALGDRAILFVGDSTNHQLASAVHNYIIWGGGACGPQLVTVTSDTLIGVPSGGWNRGVNWTVAVLDAAWALGGHVPEFIIVGAAAHVRGTPNAVRIMSTLAAQFAASEFANRSLLVWRTSLGAGCADDPLPAMPADTAAFYDETVRPRGDPYAYHEMEAWDDLALAFWRDVRGADVLDLRPLWRRPDARVTGGRGNGGGDCVHVCLPGPLLLAARMLFELVSVLHPL